MARKALPTPSRRRGRRFRRRPRPATRLDPRRLHLERLSRFARTLDDLLDAVGCRDEYWDTVRGNPGVMLLHLAVLQWAAVLEGRLEVGIAPSAAMVDTAMASRDALGQFARRVAEQRLN
jgi:hypothetical protein